MKDLYRCPLCGALRLTAYEPSGCCDEPVERVSLPHHVVDAGVLSGETIKALIDAGEIRVNPEPEPDQYQPASLDVRLGGGLYDVETDAVISEPDSDEPLVIEPGRFYLGHTLDVIYLPDYILAKLAGRSTVGRKGVVVHKTAGIFDPGFEGDATLEIYNFSERPITFRPGDRVAQYVFKYTDTWTVGYDGQYNGQRGPTPAGDIR